jgi:hypothetical protein
MTLQSRLRRASASVSPLEADKLVDAADAIDAAIAAFDPASDLVEGLKRLNAVVATSNRTHETILKSPLVFWS